MKKIVRIKNIYVYLLTVLFLSTINSCQDDSVTNNSNDPNLVTSISGTISGLPIGARLVKAVVQLEFLNYTMDSTIVNFDNSMTLNLKPAKPEFLFDIDNFFDTSGITISDHDAMVNVLMTYAYFVSSGNFAGELIKDNHTLFNQGTAGYFFINYTYCDRKCSITGNKIHINNNDTSIYNHNVNLGEGWNVLTVRIKTVRTNYFEGELFNGESPGANWYFRSLNSDLSRKSINGIKSHFYPTYLAD